MSLSNLVDGQTIKIDNHNIGTLYQWDEAIHLHKRMNSDKYRGAEVIIPIAKDGELEFRGVDGKGMHDVHIKNEIRKAFSNSTIRTNFVRTLIESLAILFNNSKISKDKWYGLFENVSCRIIRYFGLKTKIQEKIGYDIIKFSRDKGIDIYINANKEDKSITLGTDINLIQNFNK